MNKFTTIFTKKKKLKLRNTQNQNTDSTQLNRRLFFTEDSRNNIVTAGSLATGQNHANLQLPICMRRVGITRHQSRRRLPEQFREQLRDLLCKRERGLQNYIQLELLTEN